MVRMMPMASTLLNRSPRKRIPRMVTKMGVRLERKEMVVGLSASWMAKNSRLAAPNSRKPIRSRVMFEALDSPGIFFIIPVMIRKGRI